jgi:hypothetical protein
MAICGALKRIEHCRAQAADIAIIACHQRQAIGQRGRGEKAVNDRYRSDGAHASPLIGDGIVDAEHTSTECALYLPQPAFERRCLACISGRASSMPFRISPRTSVLRKRSSSAIDAYHADTCALQRSPFRTSEMMLASIK